MRSSKSRSRSKQNRPRSIGNIVNRVFDSSGPEGKVRGTPQQIIEKYQALARDAQLSNDRVAAENFSQHAEHYTRMLGEAMRELAAEQEARRHQGGNSNGHGHQGHNGQERPQHGYRREERVEDEQPEIGAVPVFPLEPEEADSGLVETPETRVNDVQPEARFEPREVREPREPREPRENRYERPRSEPRPRLELSQSGARGEAASEDTPREPRQAQERREERPQPSRGPARGPRPERAPVAARAPREEAATEAAPSAPTEAQAEAPKPRRPRAPRKVTTNPSDSEVAG